MYYLQFHWYAQDGSNWYSCAQLNVTAGSSIAIVDTQVGQPVLSEINAPLFQDSISIYHSVKTPGITNVYKHIQIIFNDTSVAGMVNLTAALTLPRVYTAGSTKMVQMYNQSMNLCQIPALTNQVYVSLFPSLDYVGNVSFIAQVYDAELNFNDHPEIEIHAKKGELFYFRSQAYSERTSSKRLIVWGRGGYAYLTPPVLNCRNDHMVPSSSNYCTDLPLEDKEDNLRNYYYGVYFDGDYDGRIKLEKGKCEDYEGVASLIMPVVLLFAMLLMI
jgi:hypothetical protein